MEAVVVVSSSSLKRKRKSIGVLTHATSKCTKTLSFPSEPQDNGSRISFCKDILRIRRVPAPKLNSIPHKEKEGEEMIVNHHFFKDSDTASYAGRVSQSDPDLKVVYNRDLTFKEAPPISKTKIKMIVKPPYCQRKIFRNPTSFSYRRLLPFLTDFENHDTSHFKHETLDTGVPFKLHKSSGVNSQVWSAKTSFTSAVADCGNTRPLVNDETQKFDTRIDAELPHSQHDSGGLENKTDQGTEGIRQLEVEQTSRENGVSRDDAKMVQECCQMTPPDSDILSKMAVGRHGGTMESNDMLSENQNYEGSSVDCQRNAHASSKQNVDDKHCTNPINKPALNPCSRLRVFKNPKSVSYRRLLPFLMNMSQENSSASSVIQQRKPQLDLKEDRHSLSSSAEQNKLKTIMTESSYEKQNTEDQKMDILSAVFPSADSHPGSSTPLQSSTKDSSNVELNPLASENPPDQYSSLDLQKEETSESQSTPTKIELHLPRNDIDVVILKEPEAAIPPCSSANDVLTEQCATKEPGQAMKDEKCLGVSEVLDKNGDVNSNQSSSESDVSAAVVTPIDIPSSKGILKRNPRGCRGPCNCLNCASFRLHADRAFEFSRNQLHDAADIASGLMAELSSLRMMLGKTGANENDLAVIQLNPVQVRQACNKALEAENEAKARLRQLNYDLNVHCRIPVLVQPKVTFASYVQERTIPIPDASISTEEQG